MARKKGLTKKQKAEKAEKLKYSRDLYARRIGNHTEVKAAVEFMYHRIITEYKVKRYQDKYRDHIRIFILDLFVANQLDPDMYITYSRNKNDYGPNGRYGKLHLGHSITLNVIEFLEKHRYIEHHIGIYDAASGIGRLPRIKATDKLIHLLADDYKIEVGMYCWDWNEGSPTVILRDENKKDMDYRDTDDTLRMKENLRIINRNMEKHAVLLYIPNNEYRKLFTRIRSVSSATLQKGTSKKGVADFTRKWVYRIFNNGSFNLGGRFYGGWWQNIPKEYRYFIRLDDKDVVECDYSGLHINMLYAMEKLPMPEGDVYHVPGYSNDDDFRAFVKQLLLTMVNSSGGREEAREAIHQSVHRLKELVLPKEIPSTKGMDLFPLMDAFAAKHLKVSHYFCTGAGIDLQFIDSQIAEQVMLHFSTMGYPILPMHDSFIIHHGLEQELKDTMNQAFKDKLGSDIKVDLKYNSIKKRMESEGNNPTLCKETLSELLDRISENGEYSIYHKLLRGHHRS